MAERGFSQPECTAGALCARRLAGDVFKISVKSLRYRGSIIKLNLSAQLSVPWERGDGTWVVW